MTETPILASASRVRGELLASAGLTVEQIASGVDEAALKPALAALDDEALALALADAKAGAVSTGHSDRLVIGADQILVLDGRRFDKPRDPVEAARHLAEFSGRTHRLVSAAVAMRGERRLWTHVAEVRLTMRRLTPEAIAAYLDRVGDAALASVGGYQLEGPGVQLFERVEGDFFTVLGLPLLPLLEFLRSQGLPEWAAPADRC